MCQRKTGFPNFAPVPRFDGEGEGPQRVRFERAQERPLFALTGRLESDVKRTFKKWHPEKNDRHAVVSPNVNSHWKTRLPTRKNAVAGGPMGL
jgi:hypothetical protein